MTSRRALSNGPHATQRGRDGASSNAPSIRREVRPTPLRDERIDPCAAGRCRAAHPGTEFVPSAASASPRGPRRLKAFLPVLERRGHRTRAEVRPWSAQPTSPHEKGPATPVAGPSLFSPTLRRQPRRWPYGSDGTGRTFPPQMNAETNGGFGGSNRSRITIPGAASGLDVDFGASFDFAMTLLLVHGRRVSAGARAVGRSRTAPVQTSYRISL